VTQPSPCGAFACRPSPNWYGACIGDVSCSGSEYASAGHNSCVVFGVEGASEAGSAHTGPGLRPRRLLSSGSAGGRVSCVAYLKPVGQVDANSGECDHGCPQWCGVQACRLLATVSQDRSIQVFNTATGECLHACQGKHRADISCLSFALFSGGVVETLSGDLDGHLVTWRPGSPSGPEVLDAKLSGPVACCSHHPSIRGLSAVGLGGGEVLIVSTEPGKPTRLGLSHRHKGALHTLSWGPQWSSEGGHLLASGSADGRVMVRTVVARNGDDGDSCDSDALHSIAEIAGSWEGSLPGPATSGQQGSGQGWRTQGWTAVCWAGQSDVLLVGGHGGTLFAFGVPRVGNGVLAGPWKFPNSGGHERPVFSVQYVEAPLSLRSTSRSGFAITAGMDRAWCVRPFVVPTLGVIVRLGAAEAPDQRKSAEEVKCLSSSPLLSPVGTRQPLPPTDEVGFSRKWRPSVYGLPTPLAVCMSAAEKTSTDEAITDTKDQSQARENSLANAACLSKVTTRMEGLGGFPSCLCAAASATGRVVAAVGCGDKTIRIVQGKLSEEPAFGDFSTQLIWQGVNDRVTSVALTMDSIDADLEEGPAAVMYGCEDGSIAGHMLCGSRSKPLIASSGFKHGGGVAALSFHAVASSPSESSEEGSAKVIWSLGKEGSVLCWVLGDGETVPPRPPMRLERMLQATAMDDLGSVLKAGGAFASKATAIKALTRDGDGAGSLVVGFADGCLALIRVRLTLKKGNDEAGDRGAGGMARRALEGELESTDQVLVDPMVVDKSGRGRGGVTAVDLCHTSGPWGRLGHRMSIAVGFKNGDILLFGAPTMTRLLSISQHSCAVAVLCIQHSQGPGRDLILASCATGGNSLHMFSLSTGNIPDDPAEADDMWCGRCWRFVDPTTGGRAALSTCVSGARISGSLHTGHNARLTAATLLDGGYALIGSEDQSVRLLDSNAGAKWTEWNLSDTTGPEAMTQTNLTGGKEESSTPPQNPPEKKAERRSAARAVRRTALGASTLANPQLVAGLMQGGSVGVRDLDSIRGVLFDAVDKLARSGGASAAKKVEACSVLACFVMDWDVLEWLLETFPKAPEAYRVALKTARCSSKTQRRAAMKAATQLSEAGEAHAAVALCLAMGLPSRAWSIYRGAGLLHEATILCSMWGLDGDPECAEIHAQVGVSRGG